MHYTHLRRERLLTHPAALPWLMCEKIFAERVYHIRMTTMRRYKSWQNKKFVFVLKRTIRDCWINQQRKSLKRLNVQVQMYQDRFRYQQKKLYTQSFVRYTSTKIHVNSLNNVHTNVLSTF